MKIYSFLRLSNNLRKFNFQRNYSRKIKTITEEWYIKENNYYKIGLTNNINDIIYIDIDDNNKFKKNEPMVIVETVKAVGEINAPFNCNIIDRNNMEDIEVFNNNLEDENNWIIKIKPDENIKNPDEIINDLKIIE
tara:strand:- start:934 stop:1341 length:408 start_codon:yes stop_codon:yes gene_type:complete